MKSIIPSMISSLLIGVLLLPGRSLFALDRINVTLPSKSFQFIIFPLARERGYMTEDTRVLDGSPVRGYSSHQKKGCLKETTR
jgi:hypothetical protein